MKSFPSSWARCLLVLLNLGAGIGSAGAFQMLWQIGTPDHGDAEFALAPQGYKDFRADGFFVVGNSEAKQD
jgi:hypothetical protein